MYVSSMKEVKPCGAGGILWLFLSGPLMLWPCISAVTSSRASPMPAEKSEGESGDPSYSVGLPPKPGPGLEGVGWSHMFGDQVRQVDLADRVQAFTKISPPSTLWLA